MGLGKRASRWLFSPRTVKSGKFTDPSSLVVQPFPRPSSLSRATLKPRPLGNGRVSRPVAHAIVRGRSGPSGVRGLGHMGPSIKASAPPGRSRHSLAKVGKFAAAGVIAAGVGGVVTNTGRPTDQTRGRQTGMYRY